MLSRKKIAVVSGLLGGLAVTFAGGTPANAGSPSGDCVHTYQGNSTCIHKHQSEYTTKDGRHVIKQDQACSTTSRHHVVWPQNGLDGGYTRVGPHVDCSNRARLPKGFKLPRIEW